MDAPAPLFQGSKIDKTVKRRRGVMPANAGMKGKTNSGFFT
jgi:hypothetical protein